MLRWWLLCGGVLTAGGMGWWVVQVTLLEPADRDNASGYGQFVLAVIGLLIIIGGWLVRAFTPAPDPDANQLADALAMAMRTQWEQAAMDRRLLQPAPLPVRWRRSTLPVAGPPAAATATRDGDGPFDPLPGLPGVTATDLCRGTRRDLHSVYGGLPSGRLLLIGAPGAGKSSAAILLLLDALRYRNQATAVDQPRIPVPVLFTLHGWDAENTPVVDWLVTRLTDVPPFRGRHGPQLAEHMLRTGRLAVFLDGLDEIPNGIRPRALQALSEQVIFRLVLLTRSAELVEAARRHGLTGAAALEIQPLTPHDVADYLRRPLTEPAPPAWRNITAALTQQPASVLAKALAIPLTVSLLRDAYPPTGPVDELFDVNRFPNAQAITDHLLDQAVSAAYTRRPGQPTPAYTYPTALHTLTFLAHHLNRHGTRDLAWWQIPAWIPPAIRVVLTGLAGALVGGLAFTAAGGSTTQFPSTLLLGLMFGLATGLGVGLVGPSKPARIRSSLRQFLTIRPLTIGLLIGLALALTASLGEPLPDEPGRGFSTNLAGGLLLGLLGGMLAEMVVKTKEGLSTAAPGTRVRGSIRHLLTLRPLRFGLGFGSATGLVGGLRVGFADGLPHGLGNGVGILLAFGSVAGFALVLMNGLLQPTVGETDTVDPVGEWRRECTLGIPSGLVTGLLFGLLFGFAVGPVDGIVRGAGIGLTVGLLMPQISTALVSQTYLAIRHRTPLRLVRFLEDARSRHLIRTVGPVYQFTHATLQDRLAHRHGSAEPAATAATPATSHISPDQVAT